MDRLRPLKMRSARVDFTRLLMACVISSMVAAWAQRRHDERELSKCVDTLTEAHDVVTDLMMRLDGAKVKRCK